MKYVNKLELHGLYSSVLSHPGWGYSVPTVSFPHFRYPLSVSVIGKQKSSCVEETEISGYLSFVFLPIEWICETMMSPGENPRQNQLTFYWHYFESVCGLTNTTLCFHLHCETLLTIRDVLASLTQHTTSIIMLIRCRTNNNHRLLSNGQSIPDIQE